MDIPYTYRNTTGATVYLVNCQGVVHVYLEQRQDGEWVTAYAPTHLGCISPPIAIAPNETFADTLRVRLIPDVHPGMLVDEIEGTYRLVWLRETTVHHYDEGGEHGWGDPLPLRHRVSNPFALLEP